MACGAFNEPEDGLDATRRFAEAVHHGNFKIARRLLLTEADGQKNILDTIEQQYRKLSSLQKDNLGNSPLVIDSVKTDSESVRMFYKNGISQQPAYLHAEGKTGVWRINLKKSVISSFTP